MSDISGRALFKVPPHRAGRRSEAISSDHVLRAVVGYGGAQGFERSLSRSFPGNAHGK